MRTLDDLPMKQLLYLTILVSCSPNLDSRNIDSKNLYIEHANPEVSNPNRIENNKRFNQLITQNHKNDTTIKHVKVLEEGLKGYDNTRIVLNLLEKANCSWKFYCYNTSPKSKALYYSNELFDNSFVYHRNPKYDYTKAEVNSVFIKKNQETLLLTDKIIISPVKGKRYYAKYNPKKLLLHKHLGFRNGVQISFLFQNDKGDQLFRRKEQKFLVKDLFINKKENILFLKLLNPISNDILYLKNESVTLPNKEELFDSIDKPIDETFDNPLNLLNELKGLSNKKKCLYHAASVAELGLGTGIIVTGAVLLGTYFEDIFGIGNDADLSLGIEPNPDLSDDYDKIKESISTYFENNQSEIYKELGSEDKISQETVSRILDNIERELNLPQDYFQYSKNYSFTVESLGEKETTKVLNLNFIDVETENTHVYKLLIKADPLSRNPLDDFIPGNSSSDKYDKVKESISNYFETYQSEIYQELGSENIISRETVSRILDNIERELNLPQDYFQYSKNYSFTVESLGEKETTKVLNLNFIDVETENTHVYKLLIKADPLSRNPLDHFIPENSKTPLENLKSSQLQSIKNLENYEIFNQYISKHSEVIKSLINNDLRSNKHKFFSKEFSEYLIKDIAKKSGMPDGLFEEYGKDYRVNHSIDWLTLKASYALEFKTGDGELNSSTILEIDLPSFGVVGSEIKFIDASSSQYLWKAIPSKHIQSIQSYINNLNLRFSEGIHALRSGVQPNGKLTSIALSAFMQEMRTNLKLPYNYFKLNENFSAIFEESNDTKFLTLNFKSQETGFIREVRVLIPKQFQRKLHSKAIQELAPATKPQENRIQTKHITSLENYIKTRQTTLETAIKTQINEHGFIKNQWIIDLMNQMENHLGLPEDFFEYSENFSSVLKTYGENNEISILVLTLKKEGTEEVHDIIFPINNPKLPSYNSIPDISTFSSPLTLKESIIDPIKPRSLDLFNLYFKRNAESVQQLVQAELIRNDYNYFSQEFSDFLIQKLARNAGVSEVSSENFSDLYRLHHTIDWTTNKVDFDIEFKLPNQETETINLAKVELIDLDDKTGALFSGPYSSPETWNKIPSENFNKLNKYLESEITSLQQSLKNDLEEHGYLQHQSIITLMNNVEDHLKTQDDYFQLSQNYAAILETHGDNAESKILVLNFLKEGSEEIQKIKILLDAPSFPTYDDLPEVNTFRDSDPSGLYDLEHTDRTILQAISGTENLKLFNQYLKTNSESIGELLYEDISSARGFTLGSKAFANYLVKSIAKHIGMDGQIIEELEYGTNFHFIRSVESNINSLFPYLQIEFKIGENEFFRTDQIFSRDKMIK